MAYAMRLEDVARQWQAETAAAGIALAIGGQVLVPDWDEHRARFDEWLAAPPEDGPDAGKQADPDDDTSRGIRLRALGITERR